MNNITRILFGFVALLLALNLTSCSQETLPVNPSANDLQSGNLEFLSFGTSSQSLQKKIIQSEFIERKKGGTLHLKYKTDDLKIDIKLKIHKDSIQDDSKFLMNIDSEQFLANLDVVFGPHGTQFSIPADLNIEVEGLDLSELNSEETIDVYYDNQEAGQWEKMVSEDIKIDFKKGKIKIKKAKLPHFSRYAVAWSR